MKSRKVLNITCLSYMLGTSVFLSGILSGCGGKKVVLPANISPPVVAGQRDPGAATIGKTNLQLSLDTVTDSRPSPELIQTGESEILPVGDLSASVARSITSVLVANGFAVGDTAPLVLSPELTQWRADAKGSKVSSEAALAVKLYDPANKLVYTGRYQGSANLQKGGLTEADFTELLQTSLNEAISQICRDQKLIELISSF